MTAPSFRNTLVFHPQAPYVPPSPQPPTLPAPPPVLSPAGQVYTQYVAAALIGLMAQRDSIIACDEELATRAYDIADHLMAEGNKRTGQAL